ncbi:MAG: mercuric reductase [Verrucomicrobia bacterium]|nr:MAG: mercuric reductase [Verrucomicrobiota bacterium]
MNPEATERLGLHPADDANQRLADAVHPADWPRPEPAALYDLVVVGAGTAGLVVAAGAAGLGARVALVERHLMGGDCLNAGCVPSKSLLAAAHAAHAVRRASILGIRTGPVAVDFAAVMRRLRETRAALASHDSAARFRSLGVDVFLGNARFVRTGETEVDGVVLRWRKAVIATGARASLPDVPGLAAARPLTHETVFNLTELPRHLAVIGAGPIGCELAQAFRRLGSEVTLVASGPRPLPRDEPAAGDIVADRLGADGVHLIANARLSRVESPRPGLHRLHVGGPSGIRTFEAEHILVAAGRRPNVDALGLDAVGVRTDPRRGVLVDDHLRTTNRRIFAAGDVCLRHQFTHAADFSARIVIQNALFFGRKRASALNIPWCTYTDPEVAQVGLTEAAAAARGIKTTLFAREFADVDRARTAAETDGFVRILVRAGTDRILGATIVGARAGEMISEISVAMAAGMGLGRLAAVIHPYPTMAEAIRQCGDAYNRTRLTPRAKWFLGHLLRL